MTYDRINWENEPSENTPLSAENLNKMDSAIKQLSEMVVANPVEADTDELKKITIEGTVYKIAGGHELVNASGSTMTQRSKMSFPDSHLTDDSGNNQTIVDIIKEVTTAQWNNATEEGLYYINDKPDSIITAEQVAYDENNSVGDILGGDTLKFEVGTFPITFNSVSGNITGIKATNISTNRYTIIGTELASGVLGQDTYVYNSWSNTTRKLDNFNKNLTLTKGGYLNNVDYVKGRIINDNTLVVTGVAYLNTNIVAQVDILDLGYNFGTGEYFGYIYSLGSGIVPVRVTGTKLKSNVRINEGNLYFQLVLNF